MYCRDQMLAVVVLSQHQVSSSIAVRPLTLRDARCVGHAEITWSAVCSMRHTCNSTRELDLICTWTNENA